MSSIFEDYNIESLKNEENPSLLKFSSILGAPDLKILELDFLKTNLDSILDLTRLEIFEITDTSGDLAHGCLQTPFETLIQT